MEKRFCFTVMCYLWFLSRLWEVKSWKNNHSLRNFDTVRREPTFWSFAFSGLHMCLEDSTARLLDTDFTIWGAPLMLWERPKAALFPPDHRGLCQLPSTQGSETPRQRFWSKLRNFLKHIRGLWFYPIESLEMERKMKTTACGCS